MKKIKNGDVALLRSGNLWISTPQGYVNALESPQTFDAAVLHHVQLLDRENWPVAQRSYVLAMIDGIVSIDEDELTAEQKQQRDELLRKNRKTS